MAKVLKDIWKLILDTADKWITDKAPRMAAALAYYTIFSMAPLLVIVIGVASLAFGHDAAQGRIVEQLGGLVGDQGAKAIQDILASSHQEDAGVLATVIGAAVLVLGATGVLVELQDALNTIWGVTPKPNRGIMGIIKDRALSLVIILGVGFVLMVSLVLSAALAALGAYIGRILPGFSAVLLELINNAVSLGIFTTLLAMIYKVLPDAHISWRDVWLGAAITALLFTLGKFLIGLYLGHSGTASSYGAAGSLAILFVWVYYSSLILYFGAEFTSVYANRYGKRIVPSKNAILIGKQVTLTADGVSPEDSEAGAQRKQELGRVSS